MEKGKKTLLLLLIPILIVSIGLTYYKTVVIKDFIVIEEEESDDADATEELTPNGDMVDESVESIIKGEENAF